MLEGYLKFKSSLFHEYENALEHLALCIKNGFANESSPDGSIISQFINEIYDKAEEVEKIYFENYSGLDLKNKIQGKVLKVLTHKNYNRGMQLIEEKSRILKKNEVHELVTTDQIDLQNEGTINRAGFLGFLLIENSGIADVGDDIYINFR